ncbi:probable amino acid ABC transporter, periplasmic-binding protein [Aquitalea magnusonii]|uniref:Probable amino acid ABC transporter, periplasmic-binding protein n=1 Tax=Aquitalea magnusonii TaxID=332411 RepID=A0A3G9GHZ7_9NEIS|nr:transporter substrate-binding domain-containing protein [Aquitalea magnusonii]BBF85891.1 probable amino acid ABC transporter, periplasmic-binding protein [Aquitalea magnusonii]
MKQAKAGLAHGQWLLLLAGLCLQHRVAAQDFTVAVEESDNHPFEYVQGDGKTHGGFHLEVIDEVTARLGWHVVYKPMPWQRALRSLQLGRVDALSYLARTPERDAYAVFLPAAIQHRQYAGLFVLRAQRQHFPDSARPCSYAAYRMAAASNYFYGAIVQQAMHECWQIDMTASSKEEVFAKLLAGRIDIAVAYGTSLQSLDMRMPELQSQVVALREPRWLIGDFYLGFSRKAMSAQRIDAYVAALGRFRKTPAYQQLVSKYNMKSFLP